MTRPVLYIIMRNDLDSMNMGKGIAQGSHASNAFVKNFYRTMQENSANPSAEYESLNASFHQWENETPQGFGTVLVLEAKMGDILFAIRTCQEGGYLAEIVNDPTYPIKDGDVVHHLNLDSCAYVFVPDFETDVDARKALSTFNLHH